MSDGRAIAAFAEAAAANEWRMKRSVKVHVNVNVRALAWYI